MENRVDWSLIAFVGAIFFIWVIFMLVKFDYDDAITQTTIILSDNTTLIGCYYQRNDCGLDIRCADASYSCQQNVKIIRSGRGQRS